ncbi:MAG: hypothetical protein H6Q00_1388 [Holophagaceae bacterium]|nr:hypothetical protein [Holophagaceae bacterium]
MSDPIKDAAAKMAKRMRAFKGYSRSLSEVGETPFWEPEDEAALQAYESAMREVYGSDVPLPLEYAEAS